MKEGKGSPAGGITIHLVGYAHLDPVWLWRWTEGYQEARATFRSALDRMKEFPDYVFTCSQAAVYRWVEENDPAMMEEVVRRVKEGRWCVVGGWWMEPDCNIPSGESFARHGLYGQRYFRQKLGVTAKVGFNADSFGHNGMIPQLLRQAGMDSYLFMRPNRTENPDCPSPAFRWSSPDGSEVLAYRLTHAYGTWGDDVSAAMVREIASWGSDHLRHLMLFFGVGNHGGGPTVQNLQSLVRLQSDKQLPRLVFGSPQSCLTELEKEAGGLPRYSGDWQHHASGCYAACSEVKRLNRSSENALLTAEKLSVLASTLAGWRYAGADFARAWQNVLFCQFHDVMAGTCIQEAYDDVRQMFGETLWIANHETNGAAQRLAGHMDTRGPGTPVVVFNPHAFPVKAAVECDMTRESGSQTGAYALVDDAGVPVAWQRTPASAIVQGRRRLCFVADVPPMGYRTYRLSGAAAGAATAAASGAGSDLSWIRLAEPKVGGYDIEPDGREDLKVENRWFSLVIDGHHGDVLKLTDKRSSVDVFGGHAAVPIVVDDPTDTWSHGVFTFHEERGRFGTARVRVVEEGPVRIVVRARSSFGASALLQDFIVYREIPRITVRAVVDWHERLSLLKISFPVNVQKPLATYEIPYGHIRRPCNGEEEPGQSWVDVSGEASAGGTPTPYGLSVLNDCTYSFDVRGGDLRLTILRSPVYAHHTPTVLEENGDYVYMDQGRHAFSYELVPHAGSWQDGETVRTAQVLNAPLVALVEHVHAGDLPASASHLRVDAPNVIVTVLKQREDSRDLVLRCYESAGQATEATIDLPLLRRTMTVSLKACEIKTFVIPREGSKPVAPTDFLED